MSENSNALTTQSRLCLALMRLGTRMSARFDVRFAKYELTQAQFRILLGVWQVGKGEGVTPSTLADYLFIERPTATALAEKLVGRGLLVRVPDPTDRRSHTLRLTKPGGELLESTGIMATRLGAQTMAPFSDTEQESFLQLLTRLEEHLRQFSADEAGLLRDGDG